MSHIVRHVFELELTRHGLFEVNRRGAVLGRRSALQTRGSERGSRPATPSNSVHKWTKGDDGTSLSMVVLSADDGSALLQFDARRNDTSLHVEIVARDGTVLGTDQAEIYAEYAPILVRSVDEINSVRGVLHVRGDSDDQHFADLEKVQAADYAWLAYSNGSIAPRKDFDAVYSERSPFAVTVRSLREVAKEPAPLFMSGETGTGKTHIARGIHDVSGRGGQFLDRNAAYYAGDPTYARVHFFGCEKNGGYQRDFPHGYLGDLRRTREGTLFIDEFQGLPEVMTFLFLTSFEPEKMPTVDTADGLAEYQNSSRLIAASSVRLRDLVRGGKIPDPLAQRFGKTIEVPRLADRLVDIPVLVEYYLKDRRVDERLFKAMVFQPWPGNIRGLVQLCASIKANTKLGSVLSIDEVPQRYRPELERAFLQYEVARKASAPSTSERELARKIAPVAKQLFEAEGSSSDIAINVDETLTRVAVDVFDTHQQPESLKHLLLAQGMERAVVTRICRLVYAEIKASIHTGRAQATQSVFFKFFGYVFRHIYKP